MKEVKNVFFEKGFADNWSKDWMIDGDQNGQHELTRAAYKDEAGIH